MSTDSVHRYVLAYDISNDGRRVAIAKTLEAHGDRLQYSVFVVDLKPARLVRLRSRVTSLMDLSTDSLMVIDLGPRDHGGTRRIDFVGQRRRITPHGPLVV